MMIKVVKTKEENVADTLGTAYAYFDCELLSLIVHNFKILLSVGLCLEFRAFKIELLLYKSGS